MDRGTQSVNSNVFTCIQLSVDSVNSFSLSKKSAHSFCAVHVLCNITV